MARNIRGLLVYLATHDFREPGAAIRGGSLFGKRNVRRRKPVSRPGTADMRRVRNPPRVTHSRAESIRRFAFGQQSYAE